MAKSSIGTILVVLLITYSGMIVYLFFIKTDATVNLKFWCSSGYEMGMGPVEALTCCIDNPMGSNCMPGTAQEIRCNGMCNLRCGKGLGGYCVEYPGDPMRYCHCNC